jgi:hypothetical protein
LLASGVPVREVQQLAGHASLATTQRYADAVNRSNRQVSKIMRRKHSPPSRKSTASGGDAAAVAGVWPISTRSFA